MLLERWFRIGHRFDMMHRHRSTACLFVSIMPSGPVA
jgi:hypothetical protein